MKIHWRKDGEQFRVWLDGWAGDAFEVITAHRMQLISDHADGLNEVFPNTVQLVEHGDDD